MKHQISQEKYDYLSNKILLDYVKDATPIVWHQMAMDWNYDSDNAFFDWLIDNPQTDRATVLMIYWMSAPQLNKQYKDRDDVLSKEAWYIDDFDFIETLEPKLLQGFFQNNNFSYNPKGDHTGTDWTTQYSDLKMVREIPAQLYQAQEGLIVPEANFIEGIPQDVEDQWQRLDEEYKIV